jgi:hypothetical protein
MLADALRAGIYSNSYDAGLNVRNGFPVFGTCIEANFVNKQEDAFAAFKLSDEDRQELHRLARDPRIGAQTPVGFRAFLLHAMAGAALARARPAHRYAHPFQRCRNRPCYCAWACLRSG